MKVLLISIGSRGDIEPFLAAAEILAEKGHRVECCFPEQFRSVTEELGYKFHSLGSELLDLLKTKDGQVTVGGGKSLLTRIKSFYKLSMKSISLQKEMLEKQRQVIDYGNYDKVVFHIKAMYPIIWGLKQKRRVTLLFPVPFIHKYKSSGAFSVTGSFPRCFSALIFFFAKLSMLGVIKKSYAWLDLKKDYNRKDLSTAFDKMHSIYCVSPTLFPKPKNWDADKYILGFMQRKVSINWRVPKGLESFLNRHKKVLFLTFGSMTNADPQKRTKLFLKLLTKHKIPCVINTCSGGLVKPDNFDSELFYFVSDIPYTWILPRVYAAIHHGGAGTTHGGLRAGCATLIIPHIIDQFFWNNLVASLGAGPKGVSSRKLCEQNLEPLLLDLLLKASYKKKALGLSQSMAQENFMEEIYHELISQK